MNYSSVTATVAGKVNPFYGQCVPLLPEKLLEKGRIGETQREEWYFNGSNELQIIIQLSLSRCNCNRRRIFKCTPLDDKTVRKVKSKGQKCKNAEKRSYRQTAGDRNNYTF